MQSERGVIVYIPEQNINLDLKIIQKISYEEIEFSNPEGLFVDDNSADC